MEISPLESCTHDTLSFFLIPLDREIYYYLSEPDPSQDYLVETLFIVQSDAARLTLVVAEQPIPFFLVITDSLGIVILDIPDNENTRCKFSSTSVYIAIDCKCGLLRINSAQQVVGGAVSTWGDLFLAFLDNASRRSASTTYGSSPSAHTVRTRCTRLTCLWYNYPAPPRHSGHSSQRSMRSGLRLVVDLRTLARFDLIRRASQTFWSRALTVLMSSIRHIAVVVHAINTDKDNSAQVACSSIAADEPRERL